MGNKSLKKDYTLKHSYNFGDFDSPAGRRFTKKTSHKEVRSRLNKAARNDAVAAIVERMIAANKIGIKGESYE